MKASTARRSSPARKKLPEKPKKTRRNLRSLRTRQQIAESAIELFERKGFSATMIDQIAKHADVSVSTVFRLFADKEEIVFYDFGDRLEELRARFAAPHPDGAWHAIRAAFISNAHNLDRDDLVRRRARLFHLEPVLYARYLTKSVEWEHAITQLVVDESGESPEARLYARLVAGSAVSAFRAAFWAQVDGDGASLEPHLVAAFSRLEHIGEFFSSKPGKIRKARSRSR